MMDRRVKERLVGATILVALIVLVVPELLSGPKPTSAPPLEQGLPASTREVKVDLATSKATTEPAATASAPSAPGGADAEAVHGALEPNANEPESGPPSSAAQRNETPPTIATLRAQQNNPSSTVPPPLTPPPQAPAPRAPLESPAPVPKSGVADRYSASGEMASPRFNVVNRTPASGETAAQRRSAWSVQLGSFANRANADKLARRLQGSGSSVYVISSGSGSSLRYRVRIGPLTDRGAAERAVVRLRSQGHAASIVTPSAG